MKDEYDFSKMKQVENPVLKKYKKQITINLKTDTIEYFKLMARKSGLPYQNLIDLYLEDCARNQRQLTVNWD